MAPWSTSGRSGKLARLRPVEGLQQAVAMLEQTVAALEQDAARMEQGRLRAAGLQRVALALLGLAATPGLAALAWLTFQRGP